jgi:3-dehydroquinate synthase
VGDIAGFAAACYMRGIRLLQAPTTLLAQVDSSVGGKTGVNHPSGKNLIGAFHQPHAVVADMTTLRTLPGREFRAGLAEVVKYGAIRDAGFFEWLERNAGGILEHDESLLEEMVRTCVANKAEVVAMDERESGVRATLNFGHTFGHALESVTGYERFLHGEAVAIGMVQAAELSHAIGICDLECSDRIRALLRRFGLPVSLPPDVDPDAVVEAIALDKKALSTGLRFILLDGLGHSRIHADCSRDDIESAIRHSQCRS